MTTERIVIVGGPRCSKSTLARELRARGIPTFCGDPRSTVKEPEDGVTYLPEGLGFGSEASQWIVDYWLPMPGPWVIEGHVTARVLRKWDAQGLLDGAGYGSTHYPCDRVIVFRNQLEDRVTLPGQRALHAAVMKQWEQVADYFGPITEYR